MAGLNSYHNSADQDYSQFYSGGMTPPQQSGGMLRTTVLPQSGERASTLASGTGLTTRTVSTVPVNRVGTPILPQQTAQAGMMGRGLPSNWRDQQALGATAGLDRLPSSPPGYGNGTGISQQALAEQGGWTLDPRTNQWAYVAPKKPNAAVAAIDQAVQTPMLPVKHMTPEIEAAYADVQAGKKGAEKRLANALAAEAGKGNVGRSPVGSSGGQGSGRAPSTPILPQTIRGSSTGRTYAVGTKGVSGGYMYEATPTGFVKIGVDPSMSGMSAAERYAALNKPSNPYQPSGGSGFSGGGGSGGSLLYSGSGGDGYGGGSWAESVRPG